MFPGGMPDLTQIVLRAQQMQADMERAQESLAHSQVTGSAGGGLVTATVTGSGELTGLTLDPSVVDPQDSETLADLVIAAVRDANRRAQEMSSEKLGAVTGGLAESFDLSSLGLGGFGAPGATAEIDEELDDDDVDDDDELDDAELDDEPVDGSADGDADPAVAVYQDGAEATDEPDGPVVVAEAELIESGHPTDLGEDLTDSGPADRAAPGRS